MVKVTSKLQVTVSKALAAELEIRPGDEVDWAVSGNGLRVTRSRDRRQPLDLATRLRLFDQATDRQRLREHNAQPIRPGSDRGWSREDLHDRMYGTVRAVNPLLS